MTPFVVYRPTDRIRLKFGDTGIVLLVSPLTHEQRLRIASLSNSPAPGSESPSSNKIYSETLRYGIKGIDGVQIKYPDGSDFKLEFEGDALSEDSLDALTQVFETSKLAMVSVGLLGNKLGFDSIEGVEVDAPKKTKKKPPR